MGLNADAAAQAAVTDALYFLIIVTALCAFLFAFANQYGTSVNEQLASQYLSSYATGALKTILYSSTPREPTATLYSEDAEIDYLLAYVKEDYADDSALEPETMFVLAKDVNSIMAPISDSFDYLFLISMPQYNEYVYVLLHMSLFEISEAQGFVEVTPKTPAHRDYLCGLGGPNPALWERIGRLKANIGLTYQSTSQIKMVRAEAISSPTFDAQVDLIMWVATDISRIFDEQEWCCVEINEYLGGKTICEPSSP